MKTVVVAGTGTEVGKTWVTCRTIESLRAAGAHVAARKPAQSYDDGTLVADTDAGQLGAATGDPPEAVCPPHRWYEVAMAPPMAAEVLGRPAVRLDDLLTELTWPDDAEIGFIETAGGVRSPQAVDGDVVDLADALEPDAVVLVAHAQLGVLNAVRLCLDALAGHRVVVHVNHHDEGDDLARRNLEWLRDRWGIAVETDPAALARRLR